jgi:hypothetical protein
MVLSFPTELLLEVASHLPDRIDLIALCLVYGHLRDVYQHLLHERVVIPEARRDDGPYYSRIGLLNRTFTKRPDLGKLVKYLEISPIDRPVYVDEAEIRLRPSRVQEPPIENGDEEETFVSECLVAGVLLDQLPALERLNIQILQNSPYPQPPHVFDEIRYAIDPFRLVFGHKSSTAPFRGRFLPEMPALRKLEFHGKDIHGYWYAPPNLEELSIGRACRLWRTDDTTRYLRCFNVRTLSLQRSTDLFHNTSSEMALFRLFILRLTSLTRLSLHLTNEWYLPRVAAGGLFGFSSHKLINPWTQRKSFNNLVLALRPVAATLQVLEIDCGSGQWVTLFDPIQSLVAFQSLREVTLPQ